MVKNLKIIYFFLISIFYSNLAVAYNLEFKEWVKNFKIEAINYGVSGKVVEDVLWGAKISSKSN